MRRELRPWKPSEYNVERRRPKYEKEQHEVRFLEKLLRTLGMGWLSNNRSENLPKTQEHVVTGGEREALQASTCELNHADLDYDRIGIFWEMDLQSAHSDFLVDIVRFAFSRQACYPPTTEEDWHKLGGHKVFTLTNLYIADVFHCQRLPTEVFPLACYLVAVAVSKMSVMQFELEDLSVAALRLAVKVESQHSLDCDVTSELNPRALDFYEREILQATDFRLLVCTPLFFMRLLQKIVQKQSWQWTFAKFASQLAACQIELATLKPAFLAGVVMRLTCLLANDDTWTSDCYKMIGEDSSAYHLPHAILCRLILSSRLTDQFAESYHRYRHTVDYAISLRPGWMEEQARAANSVKMLGNHVFP
ncbi:hypothetical protein Q1695_007070 [Nippostrongylus brasiliensis]|nr:hypothetical protein Q1695_007070 [Nippostrongylus brasiliensis]